MNPHSTQSFPRRLYAVLICTLALCASLLGTVPAAALDGTVVEASAVAPAIEGTVAVSAAGTEAVNVQLSHPLPLDDVDVSLTHDSDFAGVFLVDNAGVRDVPWTAAWMHANPDAVCDGISGCEKIAGQVSLMSKTPDTMNPVLPAGSYQLIVATEPPGVVSATLALPGSGQVQLPLAPADNVQLARIADEDPASSANLWWGGQERDVDNGAVFATHLVLAGSLQGPGEFNYCMFKGDPPLRSTPVGSLSYAGCAGAFFIVGGRTVTLESDYATSLSALGFPVSGGTWGQGAHYAGVIDVKDALGVSVWIDP